MGMSGGGSGSGVTSEINVTPMVDIMLVLLIIFMVITPLLQQGVTVTIPRTRTFSLIPFVRATLMVLSTIEACALT